jgi:septal ring factor EnvC (AmiA/AmiB activator)
MCGIKSRIFLLGLAVLLLLPSYSFSAVVLTDEQEKALNQHLEGLEMELKSAKQKLKEQGNQLSDAKIYSNEQKIKLNKLRKELSEAKTSLEKLKKDSTEQKDTLQQLEKSLRLEKRQQRLMTIKVSAITFVIGAVAGAAGTGYYFAKR